MLAMPMIDQKLIWQYYEDNLAISTQNAQSRGEIDQGITPFIGDHIRKEIEEVIHTDAPSCEFLPSLAGYSLQNSMPLMFSLIVSGSRKVTRVSMMHSA